ncbi:carbohydrate ABC transporter permease [Paenibacillus agricola]|uniref:Carbohydrate ABC transporter permease n=1 Tax=Paenibacillus agricola TaxID=2716264 RepID=A0ABX0JAU4_9BACL|nr:carbohydrate ABC transporter permease [Paenibacillus agricola]NHN32886.1 carbohydrate ABC transporter permease [Paenibacillus agricola]
MYTKGHSFADIMIYIVTALISLICIAPFIYIVSVSLTDPSVYVPFKLYLIPDKISFASYAYILSTPSFISAIKNTLFVTIVGTALNIAFTYTMAYALTKKQMPHRNLFLGVVIFALLFNAGIVPNYLLVKNLGLMNSLWALILPVLTNSWSLIVAKSFIDALPEELEESAKIDGCTDLGIFFRIIIPLSKASIATLTLFFAVGHWNTYFTALIYLTDSDKRTLQVYVKSLLVDASTSGAGSTGSVDLLNLPSETVRMATVILAMLPIMAVYPFVQRYFIKGAMLGSIKG